MSSFRTMFHLRKIEWVPILLGVVIGVVGNLSVFFMVWNALDARPGVPISSLDGPLHWLTPIRIIGIGLFLFGIGCWIWRLNQWLMEWLKEAKK